MRASSAKAHAVLHMNVLLINPPVTSAIHSDVPLFVSQNEGVLPPLGLMYLSSSLKKSLGCKVRILDALNEAMSYKAIAAYLKDFQPHVVGISVLTHNIIDVFNVAEIVKKIDSTIHVCLGGAHAGIFPYETIRVPWVDSVIMGEGEEPFTETIAALGEHKGLDGVKGILFKRDGSYMHTGLREKTVDLDRLPFPDRAQLKNTFHSIIGTGLPMTTMISSRGCPCHCSFCSTPKEHFRMRSPENVVAEIEECKAMGIEEVHFVDDTFNSDIERVMKICDELKRKKVEIRWSFRGRADRITFELLQNAQAAGCFRIHLGVETSSDEGLRRLKKGITIREVKEAFSLLQRSRIQSVAYFLIGCPHEKNRSDILKTIRFAKEISPDFALFNILTPYPSTALYEEGLQRKILKNDLWKDFALQPDKDFQPQIWEEFLTRKELMALLHRAYRQFYFRPQIVLKNLKYMGGRRILGKKLRAGFGLLRLSAADLLGLR